jgi:hypothetical protein
MGVSRNKIVWLAIVLLGLLLLIVPTAADKMFVQTYSSSFNTSVNATPTEGGNVSVGVDTGKHLRFGRAPTDSNITKFINLSVSGPTLITVQTSGTIKPFLNHNKGIYIQKPGREEIAFKVSPTTPGYYTGTITINYHTLKQPNSRLGKAWLALKSRFY